MSAIQLAILAGEVKLPHQLKMCNQLACRLNKWDQLVFLLNQILLTQSADAINMLSRWYEKFNQSGVQPSAKQIELVASLLDNPLLKTNIRNYGALCDITFFFNR